MTAITYPVAETAEQALHAPRAFAEREREAVMAAGGAVAFVSEAVGPAFATEALAESAYARSAVAPGPWRTVRPVLEGRRPPPPMKPRYEDGRRWPEPKPVAAPTLWRMSISYWRILTAFEGPEAPARKLRRSKDGEGLDPRALQSLAAQPLRAERPQRPLDIGLFEVAMPEAPDRIMPDE